MSRTFEEEHMPRIASSRRALVGLVFLAVAAVTACSANQPLSAAAAGNGHSTTPPAGPAATTAPPAATAPTPSSATALLPMQTAQGGEFLSPSGNISCEVDYNRDGETAAYCQTGTPAQSVTMSANGSYTTCTGVQCLANAGIDTPTLAYGTATGVGPFVCASATTGVTCTVDGKGFQISRSGITAV
jgi:hypothetical protein